MRLGGAAPAILGGVLVLVNLGSCLPNPHPYLLEIDASQMAVAGAVILTIELTFKGRSSSSSASMPETTATSRLEASATPTAEPAASTTAKVLPSPSSSGAAATQSSSSSSSSGSSSNGLQGPAAAGTTYVGDLTWYQTGLGSCGRESGYSDHIVAVSHDLMRAYATANSNDNPLCGKQVQIHFNGQTFPATVVDTCEACSEGDLDLSQGFFSLVTGGQTARGRIPGVQWQWT